MAHFVHLLIILQVLQVYCDDGVILFKDVKETGWDVQPHFCIYFNPLFHNLTTERGTSPLYRLTDLSGSFGCKQSDYSGKGINGTAVMIDRGNCTFSTKARIAQSMGALVLIITSNDLISPAAENASVDYEEINIVVATVLSSKTDQLRLENRSMDVLLYAPQISGKFDPSAIVIFLIAFTNIAIGGYWAGYKKHGRYEKMKNKRLARSMTTLDSNESGEAGGNSNSQTDEEQEEGSVDLSLPGLLVFFVLVCGFLVLLYFFYDELVYVLIGMFCLAGAMGLYSCVSPIWKRVVCFSGRLPRNKIPLLKSRPEYRFIVLALLCAGVAVFWGIVRHASYAWILQDILGYAFCLNVMKTLGVPNMRVCTVMLILLFIYDVFFVFVTPLITSTGDSVMVKVATGSGSKTHEQLPMVFKVPKLTSDVINVCPLPYSLLGFGDIVIPGLLVSHNHAFGLYAGTKIYYLCTVAAYGVGLILTFVALSLMETGQPALLYLVPCTLVTTFLIGCARGEVKLLWAGMNQSEKEEENRSECPASEHNQSTGTLNSNTSGSASESEDRTLLKK